MGKKVLFISAMLLFVTGAGVEAVSASTDCDRWLREYKQHLAESQPVRKVLAHRRVRRLLHPQPHVARVTSPVHHIRTPKLSPEEMLRRFHILCGDLPPDDEMGLVPQTPLTMIVPQPLDVPASSILAPPPPASFPPTNERTPSTPHTSTPPIAMIPPGGIIPGLPTQPSIPGTPIGPPPGDDLPPTSPITPVVPPVPEPNTLVLLLTGFAGAFALGLRRTIG